MCYSAMVEQDAKSLQRQFGVEILIDHYAELFSRRLNGEKLYLNKAMELPFLQNPTTMAEKSIGKTIREWQEKESARLNLEIEKQSIRLEMAIESLKQKETKKALEDQRIATNKISKSVFDLKSLKKTTAASEADSRIFPFHYMSVVCVDDQGQKVVRPMRYLMRPQNAKENFDHTHNGCYNARFDNLTRVPFWKDSLENGRRGIIVVQKFFENVPTKKYLKNRKLPTELSTKENIVVCFEPQDTKQMLIPILWDKWQKKGHGDLYSAALLTDDPPPEVSAAGHDRCPIFLKKSAVEDWLFSKETGKDLKEGILMEREQPYYEHRVMGTENRAG